MDKEDCAQRTDSISEAWERPSIFLSSEFKNDIRLQMGQAHYSYRLVAERFARSFPRYGFPTVIVERPEKYKTLADLRMGFGNCTRAPVHISFRSTEHIRPMPAALNISHFAWEFDVLKDRQLISGPIAANQKHMLSLADEIWVPSRYSYESLTRHGLDRTHVVPIPICGTSLPERLSKPAVLDLIGTVSTVPLLLSSGLSRELNGVVLSRSVDALSNHPSIRRWLTDDARIFLTICNPHDLRKNLLNMIEGFQIATENRNSDLFIVKLIVPNDKESLSNFLSEHLLPRFDGPVALHLPRVVFVWEYLTNEQIGALYSLADFYLCASHCEGLNAPLLEAMSYGTFPISTCNTGMRDFIDQENAIVVAERRFPGLLRGMASDVSGISQSVSVASRFDVADAVRKAADLPPETYKTKASRSRALVLERYGEPAVMQVVQDRLKNLLRLGRKKEVSRA